MAGSLFAVLDRLIGPTGSVIGPTGPLDIKSDGDVIPHVPTGQESGLPAQEMLSQTGMSSHTGKHDPLGAVFQQVQPEIASRQGREKTGYPHTVRKRIKIPCGILIQDGDMSVTLQTIIAYFSSKLAFELKNHIPIKYPPSSRNTHIGRTLRRWSQNRLILNA